MRESEEHLIQHTFQGNHIDDKLITTEEASYAVKLAYKEGYLDAKADILQLLRQEEGLLMISAIVAIREMKVNV